MLRIRRSSGVNISSSLQTSMLSYNGHITREIPIQHSRNLQQNSLCKISKAPKIGEMDYTLDQSRRSKVLDEKEALISKIEEFLNVLESSIDNNQEPVIKEVEDRAFKVSVKKSSLKLILFMLRKKTKSQLLFSFTQIKKI